ncbi:MULTISPECIES: polysaccharide biosynthesis tyrosine autokinase [Microbacterium]|jgi:capsular exopolysaccharide synthesis family protein|uniref:polysaccharide biosynthesis tyrosine autokinase n=1 Tax=Microbacterium TaxID=33882 RepID=UPI001E3FB9CB|nr:polysaccharide biosynthesis tyrosine autokinase [Microbacterium nymphoidis]MCD2499660.1 polysaccharide biosynthesis tyrosine autokinase [Microbacterium nymphoidis]
MTLHDYAAAIRSHAIVILLLIVLGGAVGFTTAQFLPDQYRSQASVMVIADRGDTTSELAQGATYVQSLVQTYTVLASSPAVLDPVITELGLDTTPRELAARVSASARLGTVVIDLQAVDEDPQAAQRIADAVAAELSVAVEDASPRVSGEDAAVRVDTIAPATLPAAAFAPDPGVFIGGGMLLGLALGLLAAVADRRFNARLATRADIETLTETPVLGEIGHVADGRTLAGTIRATPDGALAEAMRQVTASLRFLDLQHQHRVLMITSADSAEGKSSVSLALALTLAEMNHRVLYLEADLRRPSAAEFTQLESAVGLTSVLLGEATLDSAAQSWAVPGLRVLTSGLLPPNPGQVLATDQLRAVLAEARASYDYVIVDTAPVIAVSDAKWLLPIVDGTILIVRSERTPRANLQRSLRALAVGERRALGIVLNDSRTAVSSVYYGDDEQPAPRAHRLLGWMRRRL